MRLVLQVLEKKDRPDSVSVAGKKCRCQAKERAGAMLPRTRTKTRMEKKGEGACSVFLLQPSRPSLGPLLSESNMNPSDQGKMWFVESQL